MKFYQEKEYSPNKQGPQLFQSDFRHFKDLFVLLYVFEYFDCMHVSALCVHLLDAPQLGLRMAVSYHVSDRNCTWVLCKSTKGY